MHYFMVRFVFCVLPIMGCFAFQACASEHKNKKLKSAIIQSGKNRQQPTTRIDFGLSTKNIIPATQRGAAQRAQNSIQNQQRQESRKGKERVSDNESNDQAVSKRTRSHRLKQTSTTGTSTMRGTSQRGAAKKVSEKIRQQEAWLMSSDEEESKEIQQHPAKRRRISPKEKMDAASGLQLFNQNMEWQSLVDAFAINNFAIDNLVQAAAQENSNEVSSTLSCDNEEETFVLIPEGEGREWVVRQQMSELLNKIDTTKDPWLDGFKKK